jgi:hypothetical protein
MAMGGKNITADRPHLAAAAEEAGNPGSQVLGVLKAVVVAAAGVVADSIVRHETGQACLNDQ